eukprot:112419-Prymnesium_polylepis.1
MSEEVTRTIEFRPSPPKLPCGGASRGGRNMCVLGVNSVSSVPTACALRRCGEKPTAVVAPRRGALGRRDFLRPEFIAMLNDAGGPRW